MLLGEDGLSMEFTDNMLLEELAQELARFELCIDAGTWVARDHSTDEVVRAKDRTRLLRKLACLSESMCHRHRPQFDGHPVIVAQVEREGDRWRWYVLNRAGLEAYGQRSHPTRCLALEDLHQALA
ncbi:MAG: hypothetical protein A2579_12330 [Lysobacterales bacterium RIFOXYD1_FULL_69_11]|nr:MAG: hypothetical protein A2579_12330 [Xanthomonadales bacterium RIFOXYD1_FULL_69_11]